MDLDKLRAELRDLRKQLHELYTDAAANEAAIDKAAQEIAAIQNEMEDAQSDSQTN